MAYVVRLYGLVTGLLECDVCGTLWLFTRSLASLEDVALVRCHHCQGSTGLIDSTVAVHPVLELPPPHPPLPGSTRDRQGDGG